MDATNDRIARWQLVVIDEASHLSATAQPMLFSRALADFLPLPG